MAGSNINAGDDFIRRMETELREKQTFANEVIARAQNAERDLSDDEKVLIAETRGDIERLKSQIETVEDLTRATYETQQRQRQLASVQDTMRSGRTAGPVEYNSPGDYLLDSYWSAMGRREAAERIDIYHREAAHQKTGDTAGLIPTPILGPVLDFIDAARPIVSALGARPLPGETWYRPLVTVHTQVGAQGTTGAADKEKSELVSRKMTITKLTGSAVTYGGYVNVSRQAVDFTQPSVLDIIVNDLAAQYAIETEAAVGDALAGCGTTPVEYDATADGIAAALWTAAAAVYTAVRGQGRLVLAVAPDVLGTFGPLFAPVNPWNAQSPGMSAGSFGQGIMGQISGISTLMSSGLGNGEAYLFSTAAIEAYEQRVGTLQVAEPSVLGLQVAYAGYFSPLVTLAAGIQPLTLSSGS